MDQFKHELKNLFVEKHLYIFMLDFCGFTPMIIDIDLTHLECPRPIYIKLPIRFAYNDDNDHYIDFGDGIINIISSKEIENHCYKEKDKYQIQIYGEIEAFDCECYYTNATQRVKYTYITKIQQYGTSSIKKINFYGCNNLIDIPDYLPSSVTDIKWLFFSCEKLNKDLSKFTTTQITDMSYAFAYSIFNNSLDSFDTSNVKYFECMFLHAQKFNQSLKHFNFQNALSHYDFIEGAFSLNRTKIFLNI